MTTLPTSETTLSTLIESIVTATQIRQQTGAEQWKIELIFRRREIEPIGRVGRARVWPIEVIDIIKDELNDTSTQNVA